METPLLLLFLLLAVSIVNATHFAYGTYQWDKTCDNKTTRCYSFTVELAFRRSFDWPLPTPAGSSKPPNEGDTVNVGSILTFYPMGNYGGGPRRTYQTYLIDKVNYLNDDWYAGQQDLQVVFTEYLDRNWRHYYAACCRLTSIKDTNNNAPWTLTGIINRYGLYSPRVTGLPRIWFDLLTPNLYTIPVVHPLNIAVTYFYAKKVESTLNEPNPRLPNPNNPHVVTVTNENIPEFRLNNLTGDCTWTPQQTGLYALGFLIEENCFQLAAPYNNGISCSNPRQVVTPPAVPSGGTSGTDGQGTNPGQSNDNCCTRVPFDFIIAVVPPCNVTLAALTGCAVPPYFYMPFALSVPPEWRQWNFTRGIQGTFLVCAINDDKSQTKILIDHSIFPDNSLWVLDFQSNPTCYFYSWTPGLTDTDQIICFFATSLPNGEKSRGQYCIKLHILDGNCKQISGVIRDFHYYHFTMAKWVSDGIENGTQIWVKGTTGPVSKPQWFNNPAGPKPVYVRGNGLQTSDTDLTLNRGSLEGFYDWYVTDDPTATSPPPRNLALAVQELFCSGVSNNSDIFTFLNSAFFPIDNQLFGNEGYDHNYFFTYEVNTYITYLPGQVFNLRSDDDLFVFVDNTLPNGWNLYGIKSDDTSFNPPRAKLFSLSMDTFVLQHKLDINETVRCDIFYANRMQRFPYLQIEIPNTTLCDALSVSNYLFNFQTFSGVAPSALNLAASLSNPATIKQRTINGASTWVVALTDRTATVQDSFAGVWYPSKVKASHGFISQFSFHVANKPTNGPEGFAFVLGQAITSGAGPNLGYGGTADNFAIEFDMSQSASMSDLTVANKSQKANNYSEVCFHYVTRGAPGSGLVRGPPFDANSAIEKGTASGLVAGAVNNGDDIILNMANGTVHTVRIEYQPGQTNTDPVTGITNQDAGWVRVFMSTPFGVQLAPVTQFPIPGADMAALLQGSCYIGLTAGMSAQVGIADISILSWNFRFVPTDPSSTTYLRSAQNIIAGNQYCVTVQARDACNNLITVGGEGANFSAIYVPQFCTRTPVVMSPVDNNNGSYTFCYNPTTAGTYQIFINFTGVPIAKGQQQLFQVIHAPADPGHTFAIFGEIPECYNSPKYCVGPDLGVFAARFSQYGHQTGETATYPYGRMFDFRTTTGYDSASGYEGGIPEFTSFISSLATTDFLVLATAGDFTAAMASNLKAVTGIKPAPTQLTSFQAGSTWAYIGSQATKLINATGCTVGGSVNVCDAVTGNTGIASVMARGIDSSNTIIRRFTLRSQSATSACGPYARVQSVYDDIRLPAGSTQIYSIVAMDKFGNLCDDAQVSLSTPPQSWNPDFTQPQGNRPPGTLEELPQYERDGYYQFDFLSYRAGTYQVNMYLQGTNINGSYYTVVVTPGLANVTTSDGIGAALSSATAGLWANFTLDLADRVNNTINFNNTADNITGTVYRLDSNGKVQQAIPIILDWETDPTACPAGPPCVLHAAYNATIASSPPSVTYVMNFTMNGGTATYALPNVVPGPVSPYTSTADVNISTYYPAGTQIQFTIQGRDRFQNLRTLPNDNGKLFVVSSPDKPVNGPFTVTYAGSGGIYNVQFKPQIKGPMTLSIQLQVPNNNDPFLTQGTYTVRTVVVNIIPGPADPYFSYLDAIPAKQIAGVEFAYVISSYDQYGNFRNNQPFNVPVAQATDYVLRSFIPPAGDAIWVKVQSNLSAAQEYPATGNFTVLTNATVAGNYTISAQTGLDSNTVGDVVGTSAVPPQTKFQSPYKSVLVVPAPTWGPRTTYVGPGIGGGKSGTQVWFILTAFDLYGNQEIDYHDVTAKQDPVYNPSGAQLYNVQISGLCRESVANQAKCIPGVGNYSQPTTAQIVQGPDLGTYNVTYTVPTNDIQDTSPWTDYNITILHTGGSVTYPYMVGPWSVVLPAVSFSNPTNSCALLSYANGSAGSQSLWNISDISCQSPFPPVYLTSSFLVSLTRVSDGVTISPIKVQCLKTGCGLASVQNSQFNVTFTPTINIGYFRVRVYAFGIIETVQSIAGIFVTIGPGPVWPPSCSVTGFPGKTPAGSSYPFTAALADQWNHNITDGKSTVRVNATGPKGQVVTLNVGQPVAGTNVYNFATGTSLTQAGDWTITILEDSSKDIPNIVDYIGGKFLTLTVTPGRMSPLMTYATFPPNTLNIGGASSLLSFATAGQTGFFTVYPEDQYGNSLPYPDIWSGPTTNESLLITDNVGSFNRNNGPSQIVKTPLADPSNPQNLIFTVSYTATKIMPTGNILQVAVDSAGAQIVGNNSGAVMQASPFNVTIYPAKISATYSSVTRGTDPITAGQQPISFLLNARDIYDNAWIIPNQASALNALVSIPPAPGGVPSTQGASVMDLGGGEYNFTLGADATRQASAWDSANNKYMADYTVTLNYVAGANSQQLTGAGGLTITPFTVQAGPTYPPLTTINPTPYPLIASTWRNYTVTTVDQYGNRRYQGNSDTVNFIFDQGLIDCSVDGNAPIDNTNLFTFPQGQTATPLGQGLYTLNFTGTKAGIYTLNVTVTGAGVNTVDGISMPCPQVYKTIQQVLPGPAYPPTCWYSISPCDMIPAGGTLTFFLQINDRWNNNILRAGSQWAIGFYNAPGAFATPPLQLSPFQLSASNVATILDQTTTLPAGWANPPVSDWLTPGTTPYNGSQTLTPPPAVISLKDFGNSSYGFTIQVFQAGFKGIVISAVNEEPPANQQWQVIPPPLCFTQTSQTFGFASSNSTVMVTPGGPRQFVPQTPAIFLPPVTPNSLTAAIPNTFSLQAKDYYGNNVTTDTHYYTIVIKDTDGNGYTQNVYPLNSTNGLTTFYVESAWHGNFTLSITLFPNSTIPGADNTPVSPPPQNVYVQHATCGYGTPKTPYRCPDRTCVANYIPDCGASLGGDSCTGSQVWCGTKCGTTVKDCGYCTGSTPTTCSDGHCAASCPPTPKCGASAPYACPDGYCRASAADCPSPVVCAPGYVSCPDAVSCARTVATCPTYPACSSGFQCATGNCVSTLDDCPTPVSCGPNMVLCATDGSCQTDRTKCPDQYLCYAPTPYRCGSGICVENSTQCPPSVTCFPGFVKCADDSCAASVKACPAYVGCTLAQTRCPDGSCQNNLLFCSSLPTCTASDPLLCWDHTCVAFASDCSYPVQCPQYTCPGGACSAMVSQCPTLTRCPDATPVLCTDGSCQGSLSSCPTLPVCAIETPIRCPDGQSCRAQLTDCPTLVTCQTNQVKCADGTCAIALDKCSSAVNCPDSSVRCAGGECVADYTLCPTHVTCPSGYAKCTDGSCHVSCPTTYQQCDVGQVTCPQASAGIMCAPDISACPVSFICPYPTTVRCLDSTCARTADDCPTPPKDSDYITNKVPCADGTYAADTQSCPTPVTCPSATPYKCYDSECKVALADCPVPTPCPRDAAGNPQYRCSNGACSSTPWDPICTSAATPCPADRPFQCNPINCPSADACCVADASGCDSMPNPILNCTAGTAQCQICPPNWYFCQAGTCVKDATDCTPPTCPPSLPYQCTDGLCTDVQAHCNTDSGCPWNLPTKCSPGGECAANKTMCAKAVDKNGQPYACVPPRATACLDGSCASDSNNCPPTSNGCPSTTDPVTHQPIIKCVDGSCAVNCTAPTPSTTSDPPNACPSSFPFRCDNGACTKSSSSCPFNLLNANCSGSTPFQCAVGTCVVSSPQCPPVYPCLAGYVRCGDGTCRLDPASNPSAPSCPLADTCPGTSTRCMGTGLGSGLCTADQSLCNLNATTGCPLGMDKCTQGSCTASGTPCPILPSGTGCPTGTQQCYNGSCISTSLVCNNPDGCAPGTTRCPYQSDCVKNPSTDCSLSSPAPNSVACADGSWVTPPTICPGLNGCPFTQPYRCANGQCSAKNAIDGGCPPTSKCSTGQILCADGSCTANTSNPLCPAVAPCAAGSQLCASDFKCHSTATGCPNASTTGRCPSEASPLLCPDGTCAFNLAQCRNVAGGPIAPNCPSPRVRCIDETCVDYVSACISRALSFLQATLTDACGAGVMCPDGSCHSTSNECGIIPRCPFGWYRCGDGTCANPGTNTQTNPCPATVKCQTGYTRCEDGTCRQVVCDSKGQNCVNKCLEYDGCGLQYPYACPDNRECALTSKGCANAALGNPTIKANQRRLLQTMAQITTPCLPQNTVQGFCMAMVKAALTIVTVDTTQTSTIDIALDPNNIARLSLKFSSGSFVLKDGGTVTGVQIRPVGESRMRYAVNEVHATRKKQFGSFLPFSTTVLSPAFECQVDPNVREPFNINVTVQAYYDRRANIVNASDICLARLVELPGFTTWRCLFPSPADRDINGPYFAQKDPTLPIDAVESVISFCTPPVSSESGILSTQNSSAYAFIWSPLAQKPQSPDDRDVIQKNIVWIILGVLLGIAGLVLLTYCAFRLYRYRNKYKEQKEEADRLQEEVENMRQFGGEAGNKDDQVNMTANPLAVQLKDVQAKFNEEDLKLQQAEADLRKQEGEIRQEHIRNMRENRDQLASQLEKLKRQLAETQAASAPKATYEDDQTHAYATDEPVREEFDAGGSAGAQPRRQKRDL